MAIGYTGWRWNSKPPVGSTINRGHPLASGLHRVWLFNLGSSLTDVDLVTNDIATHSRVSADTRYSNGQRGLSFQSGATGGSVPGDGFLATRTLGFTISDVSVACGFRIHTTNGGLEKTFGQGPGGTLFTCREAITDISPTLAYFESTGLKGIFSADSTGLAEGAKTTTTLVAGQEYDLVGTYQRDTSIATFNGTWKTYLNGTRDGTDNNFGIAGIFSGTFTDSAVRLCNSVQWLDSAHMFVRYIYVWRRVLEAQEVADLYADPFAFINPPGVRRPFIYDVPAVVAGAAVEDNSFAFSSL